MPRASGFFNSAYVLPRPAARQRPSATGVTVTSTSIYGPDKLQPCWSLVATAAAAAPSTVNWATYTDPNPNASLTPITHVEGITTDGMGGYNLASDSLSLDGTVLVGAAIANVPRTTSGAFGAAKWNAIAYPNSSVTFANTVYQNAIVGVYLRSGVENGYVATVPGF